MVYEADFILVNEKTSELKLRQLWTANTDETIESRMNMNTEWQNSSGTYK